MPPPPPPPLPPSKGSTAPAPPPAPPSLNNNDVSPRGKMPKPPAPPPSMGVAPPPPPPSMGVAPPPPPPPSSDGPPKSRPPSSGPPPPPPPSDKTTDLLPPPPPTPQTPLPPTSNSPLVKDYSMPPPSPKNFGDVPPSPGSKLQAPPEKGATIKDALAVTNRLVTTPLPLVDTPAIQPASLELYYENNQDSGFEDCDAYHITVPNMKLGEETAELATLDRLLLESESHAVLLYTWRSCSLAIPAIKSNEQANRMEIYQTTVDILDKEIDKLRDFMKFQKTAVTKFCDEVKMLCHKDRESDFISETYLITLGKMLNMFAVLDELKNIKASIKNDCAAYKRAAEIVKKLNDPSLAEELRDLTFFLANNGSISESLKTNLQLIPGYDDLLADIINQFLHMYEHKQYMLPDEKNMVLKVMGFGLYLMDSASVNINKSKKVNLAKIDKTLKHQEVVPLYGDMMIKPFLYIEKTPNFDESKWSNCKGEHKSRQADLVGVLQTLRKEQLDIVSELSWHDSSRKKFFENHTKREKTSVGVNEDFKNKQQYSLALRGLQHLSSWTSAVKEMISWKLLHPAVPNDKEGKSSCPVNASEYERATKYNYNSKEKSALVHVIAMIKSTQEIMERMSGQFINAIKKHIYAEIQDYIQIQLREPLRKSSKHKKEVVTKVILAVRDLCCNFPREYDFAKDPLNKGGKDANFNIPTVRKQVGPSYTQVCMMKTLLESLVFKSSNKKAPRKDLKNEYIQAMEQFLRGTVSWSYLLNFESTLQKCCDLSQLWFREFYLEMEKGKRIQFPIDMSLPWILTDHVLEKKQTGLMEYLLYPFDLYNDSANCALHHFNRQFLYEEIEAEVNLCFDQLIYKLSDQIFGYYKELAGSLFLDKSFKTECKKYGIKVKQPQILRYESLLKQKDVKILGRSIDIRKLVSQRINASMLRALDCAISKFESESLTGIIELEGLLEVNRIAYNMLKEHFELDDFEALLLEANRNVSLPYGRVTQQIFVEINYDFMPQYCYNSSTNRFVRPTICFVDELERPKPVNVGSAYLWGSGTLSMYYTSIYGLYSGFIGPPHFRAICRLVGYQDIAVIIRELMNVIRKVLQDACIPYMQALVKELPKRCRRPRYEYGSAGVIEFYKTNLNSILSYADLQPKVFQTFKEVGNAILFCLLLEHAMTYEEISQLKQSWPFLNVIPKPFVKKDGLSKEEREEAVKKEIKKLQAQYSHQNLQKILKEKGTPEQIANVDEHIVLSKEKLCSGLSVFEKVLVGLKDMLKDDIWYGDPPPSHIGEVEDGKQFHKLWSSLQFVFCLPPGKGTWTVEELFGEGLNWAGCTLMSLLGQQRLFEVFDYSYHTMKVNKVDNASDNDKKGMPVKKMVDRIRKFQILNDEIFSIINKYIHKPDGAIQAVGVVVNHLEPPSMQLVQETHSDA